MRKLVLVFCSVILVLSFLPIENVMGSNPNPDGNISFEPCVIPELNITFVEEFFRFKWKQNRFDLKLLIHCDGKNLSLRDFWEKTDRVMNWENMSRKATESMYEFGYMIEDIPQEVADGVEFLVWKIEDASFDTFSVTEEVKELVEEGYNITRFHLPDNLVLSYEDLWLYDFTVEHPSNFETIVKGVKGKSVWNLDPITYSGGLITVDNEAVNFQDIRDADVANAWNVTGQTTTCEGKHFDFGAKIKLTNQSSLTDSQVHVTFNSSCMSANNEILIDVEDGCNLTFGVLADATDKTTYGGVSMHYEKGSYYGLLIYGRVGSTIKLYDSRFSSNAVLLQKIDLKTQNGQVYGCSLDYVTLTVATGNVDLYRANLQKGKYGLDTWSGTANDILIHDCSYGVYFHSAYVGNLSNLVARDNTQTFYVYASSGYSGLRALINPDVDTWSFSWNGLGALTVYRQYTFSLTVTLPNGTAIQNANVTVKHYGQAETQDFTELTDSNGQITQKTLSMGFYNQTGGDTIYNYNPYNINITYGDYNYIGNWTHNTETDWTILLTEQPNVSPTARFTFSPSGPQTNTNVSFDASDSTDPDGSISSYAWNYGDGDSDSGSTTTHTYTSAGHYKAMLTVTDDDSATNSFNQTITVTVPQSMVSPAPVLRKTSVKTTYKGPLTYYPSWIELLQQQATITATIQLDNTICTTNITLFYTVTSDETSKVVEQGNRTFWIRPDGSKTVKLQFTAPFTWGKAETSYTLSTYTMFSLTKSDITVYPIIIRQGATVNLVRNGLIVAVLGFLGGLAYYVYRSKPKKERNVLKLPDGSEIRL